LNRRRFPKGTPDAPLPTLGYVTDGNYRIFYREGVEDVAAYFDGEPVRVLNA
jgi:hypothetical protein